MTTKATPAGPVTPPRARSASMEAAREKERARIAAMSPRERAALALALGRRLDRLRAAQASHDDEG